MGVTLSRAAIKGGLYTLEPQVIDIGKPIGNRVKTYIGIAGGNYGVEICSIGFFFDNFRICNKDNGYWPGTAQPGKKYPNDMSSFLLKLNKDPRKEGDHTYAFAAINDEVLPAYTYDRLTPDFPTCDQVLIFNSTEYTHVGVRDLTPHVQYALIQ